MSIYISKTRHLLLIELCFGFFQTESSKVWKKLKYNLLSSKYCRFLFSDISESES